MRGAASTHPIQATSHPDDLARQFGDAHSQARRRLSRDRLHQGHGLTTDQHRESADLPRVATARTNQPGYCRDNGAGVSVSYGTLMGFVRERWGRDAMARNGSIVKALFKRWPEPEVEAMVRGAALLGWQDLRAIYAAEGVGRRWAMAAYWNQENRKKTVVPESVKAIFRSMGQ
jgi:hypothetical protein